MMAGVCKMVGAAEGLGGTGKMARGDGASGVMLVGSGI